MTTVLMLDGTWSRKGARSPVAEALRELLPTRTRFQYVDYPATFGPATGVGDIAYAESVMQGVHATADAVRAVGGRVILAGYSQGAAVAVAYARLARSGSIAGVAALGNPHQPLHAGRSGIAGAIEDLSCPLWSLYAPGDPIADLPLGSPLRSLADLGDWMSIRDVEAGRRWAAEMAADITNLRRMQQWWRDPIAWTGLLSAVRYATNYFPGTKHTTDYIRLGLVARLADLIEGVAA